MLVTLFCQLKFSNDVHGKVFKQPGSKRTASILCKTDCEFLIINAEAYSDFVSATREKRKAFLLGAFSFLSSIYSSQMQHKFIYSFFVSDSEDTIFKCYHTRAMGSTKGKKLLRKGKGL